MKQNKLIQPIQLIPLVILFFIYPLSPIPCLLSFASGGDIIVVGDTKTDSIILANVSLPPAALGSEGEIRYDNASGALYILKQGAWKPLAVSKDIATLIVAANNTNLSVNRRAADYICNGTDDQAIINNAINAIANITINPSGQGAVCLLEGIYNITNPIYINSSKISLFGTGSGTVLKVPSGMHNYDVINAVNVSEIAVSQLKIDGSLGSPSYTDMEGVSFYFVNASRISKIWAYGMTQNGIALYSSTDNLLSDNYVENSLVEGIRLMTSSRNNHISGNSLRNNKRGIRFYAQCDNNVIFNNNMINNSDFNIMLEVSSNNLISDNNINGGGSGSGVQFGSIAIYNSSNNTVSGNNVQSGVTTGITMMSNSYNNAICGNNLQASASESILLNNVSNSSIYGNLINSAGKDGIKLGTNSNYNLISANCIYAPSGGSPIFYGINITNTSRGNYLAGNFIYGKGYFNSTKDTRIYDNGTNTTYTGKEKITLVPASVFVGGASTSLTIDPVTNPNSFFLLNATTDVTANITNGTLNYGGDLLILQGSPGTKNITINDTGNVNLGGSNRIIAAGTTLILIWDGDTYWDEVSYTNIP